MNDFSGKNEMTSRDYVRVLFRHKAIIILTVATVMTTVVIGLMMKTPVYQAEVKMLISGQKPAMAEYYTDIGLGMRNTQITKTQSEIVMSDPVIERAVAVLGLAKKPFDYEKKFASPLKKPFVNLRALNIEKKLEKFAPDQKKVFLFRIAMEDLRRRLKVEPVRDTELFLIKVKDFNPLGATVTANVVSRSYTIFDLEQQLAEMKLKYGEKNQAVLQLKEAIETMSKSLNGAPLPPIDAIGPASVKIIEQAKVPFEASGVPESLIAILALFMSLFLSVMLAYSFEYLDQTFRSPQEGEAFLGIRHLGSLKKKAKAEDSRDVSEQIYLTLADHSAKSLVLTSAMPGEGTAQVVSTLGQYFADHFHKKVLMIDANLKKPVLSKLLKVPEIKERVKGVKGDADPSMDRGIKTVRPNLDMLVAGTAWANPVGILESPIKEFMQDVRSRYDFVLILSAPVREGRDAAILAGFAEGVVLVINERKTRRHVVKHALEQIESRKAKCFGFILNNRTYVMPKLIYDRV